MAGSSSGGLHSILHLVQYGIHPTYLLLNSHFNNPHTTAPISTSFVKMKAVIAALLLLIFPLSVSSFTPPYRGDCRFFLDTADTREWDALLPRGLFYGVTTNPTLLERANEPCTIANLHKLASKALSYTEEFMCQSWGSTANELYQNGVAISEFDRERVVIKVPVTATGAEAASKLSKSGVRICFTACYNKNQALIAASSGVEYIAPYLGRMTDNGKDGYGECRTMQRIVDGLGSDTRILVASLRDADTIAELAMEGLDTFTFNPNVARQLFDEPLTDNAAKEFEEAAARGMSRQ